MWDVFTKQIVLTFEKHSNPVVSIQMIPRALFSNSLANCPSKSSSSSLATSIVTTSSNQDVQSNKSKGRPESSFFSFISSFSKFKRKIYLPNTNENKKQRNEEEEEELSIPTNQKVSSNNQTDNDDYKFENLKIQTEKKESTNNSFLYTDNVNTLHSKLDNPILLNPNQFVPLFLSDSPNSNQFHSQLSLNSQFSNLHQSESSSSQNSSSSSSQSNQSSLVSDLQIENQRLIEENQKWKELANKLYSNNTKQN